MVQSKAQSKHRERSRGAVRVTQNDDESMSSLFEEDLGLSEESTEFYVEKKRSKETPAGEARRRSARVTGGDNAPHHDHDKQSNEPKRASEKRRGTRDERGGPDGTNTGLQALRGEQMQELDAGERVLGMFTCVRGPDEGIGLPVTQGNFTLGRGRDNSFVLKDIAVSRIQLRIEAGPSGVSISDLGSGNGTRVNGKRSEFANLRTGDRIELGNTVLVFRANAEFRGNVNESGAVPPGLQPESQRRVLEAAERLVEELERDLARGHEDSTELYEEDDEEEEPPPAKSSRDPAGRRFQVRSDLDDAAPQTSADSPAARRQDRGKLKVTGRPGLARPGSKQLWNNTRTHVPLSEVIPVDEPLAGQSDDPNHSLEQEALEQLEDFEHASPSAPTAFASASEPAAHGARPRVAPTDQTVAFLGGPLSGLELPEHNLAEDSVFAGRMPRDAETKVASSVPMASVRDAFEDSEPVLTEESKTLPSRRSRAGTFAARPILLAVVLLIVLGVGGGGVWAIWFAAEDDASSGEVAEPSEADQKYRAWTEQASDAVENGDFVKAMFAAGKAYTLRPNDPAAQALLNTVHMAKQQAERSAAPSMPAGDEESVPAPSSVSAAEQNAQAERQRAEQDRAAEKARLAAQARAAEQARLAEQARVAEQARQRELERQRAEAKRRAAQANPAVTTEFRKPAAKPPRRSTTTGMSDADAKSNFMNAVQSLRNDDAKTGCALMQKIIAKAPKSSAWRAKAQNAVGRYECE